MEAFLQEIVRLQESGISCSRLLVPLSQPRQGRGIAIALDLLRHALPLIPLYPVAREYHELPAVDRIRLVAEELSHVRTI
jgi:hypothetical protein